MGGVRRCRRICLATCDPHPPSRRLRGSPGPHQRSEDILGGAIAEQLPGGNGAHEASGAATQYDDIEIFHGGNIAGEAVASLHTDAPGKGTR